MESSSFGDIGYYRQFQEALFRSKSPRSKKDEFAFSRSPLQSWGEVHGNDKDFVLYFFFTPSFSPLAFFMPLLVWSFCIGVTNFAY
mmetsp:Transcript_10082/g.12832  ORF Transcript_10082/g.12832 Transcript_10082/m.12832 type:complete len:86 (-) Transcript_10082:910-1167(-)